MPGTSYRFRVVLSATGVAPRYAGAPTYEAAVRKAARLIACGSGDQYTVEARQGTADDPVMWDAVAHVRPSQWARATGGHEVDVEYLWRAAMHAAEGA